MTVIAICLAVCLHIVQLYSRAASESRLNGCWHNIGTINYFLGLYHETYGHLPPAFSLNKGGQHAFSWRLLVFEPDDLFRPELKKFGLRHEPNLSIWNSTNNILLAQSLSGDMPYYCPNSYVGGAWYTNYVAVVGPQTAFPGSETRKWSDFTDGRENTALVIEIENSDIVWTEPRDIPFADLQSSDPTLKIGSQDPHGPVILFADGEAFRIKKTIPPATLQALFTINGHESVTRADLINDGFLGFL